MPQTVAISALSVAANTTSAEQLNGTLLEMAPSRGIVMVAMKASATGLNATMSAGTELVVNDQIIPFTGTAGTISQVDNTYIKFGVMAGAKLQLRFRNTTGGAITVDAIVNFQEA